jgi:hypothetical protein
VRGAPTVWALALTGGGIALSLAGMWLDVT